MAQDDRPDHWTSEDGLAFRRTEGGWAVSVARELPKRLGDPVAVELPQIGARIAAGATLLAIELSKARVEFSAPADLTVCESRNAARAGNAAGGALGAWSLEISFL